MEVNAFVRNIGTSRSPVEASIRTYYARRRPYFSSIRHSHSPSDVRVRERVAKSRSRSPKHASVSWAGFPQHTLAIRTACDARAARGSHASARKNDASTARRQRLKYMFIRPRCHQVVGTGVPCVWYVVSLRWSTEIRILYVFSKVFITCPCNLSIPCHQGSDRHHLTQCLNVLISQFLSQFQPNK